jgi:predicted O-linked N-acetylglucosamine transferase (SPINDLY family)
MGGGSALVDGLRTATPVMTLEGNDMRNSGGSSILRNLNLECLVADNLADLKHSLRVFLGNKQYRSDIGSKLKNELAEIRNINQTQLTISEFEKKLLILM